MLNRLGTLESGPYVGPRPFEQQDRNLFFGRDRETIQIISLILSSPLTLIYSQSGVGKTSLFNTKIIPELKEQYKFQTFSSARVRSLLPPDKVPDHVKNIYMFNALQSLRPDINLEPLAKHTLSSFLKEQKVRTTIVEDDKPIPRLIVFDQLEELFNLYPENWHDQQQDFFQQIAEAINEDPMLRIVLIIREEYLAHLSSFAHLLPGRLRARFRLERLDKESALLAVNEPMKQTGRFFAPGVAEKLVNDLLTMRVENIFGKIVDMKGEYVEPVHLQVVCQRLWMNIVSLEITEITEITHEHLKGSGDVNKALTEFYVDVISYATKQTGIKQDAIRKWFDEKLITSSGTRGIVHREAKTTGGISNNVVDILQGRYLVRPEFRSGSRWYELTHDRLIQPILESNKEWRQKKQKKKNRVVIITGLIAVSIVAIMISYSYLLPTTTSPVQHIVPVGEYPTSVAVNPATLYVYVANYDSDSLTIIDGKLLSGISGRANAETAQPSLLSGGPSNVAINPNNNNNTNIEDIPVSGGPEGVAINPNTNMIYVANYVSNTTSVIDGTTNGVIANIPISGGPTSVAINPNTNMIYVASEYLDVVSVINGTTNTLAAEDIPVGNGPTSVAVNPNTNMIYVANARSGTVSVIDGTTNTLAAEDIPISGGPASIAPEGVAVNPNTNMVYVAYSFLDLESASILNGTTNGVLSVINGTTNGLIDSLPIGDGSRRVAVNPNLNTNIVYVGNYWTNVVSVINGTTNSLTAEHIRVSGGPEDIVVNPNNNIVYVANYDSGTVSVIDGTTNTLVRTIPISGGPASLAINPNNNIVYVANYDSGTVSVINGTTNTLAAEDIPVGNASFSLAINPNTNMIYVANYDSGTVSVIDGTTNTLAAEDIPVGNGPTSVAVNPNTNMIYVANYDSGTVSVIDGTTNSVMSTIPVGNGPTSVAVNPNTNMIYVANSQDNTLSIINLSSTQTN